VKTEAVHDQHEPDHQQEAEAQDDERRARGDEGSQRLACDEHRQDCDHDSGNHHVQLVHHSDRRDDRIDRKHRIDDHDLRHDRPEAGVPCHRLVVRVRLDALVDLGGCLDEEEKSAADEDQIAPGELESPHAEQRLLERDHPADARQECQAHHQGEGQAEDAGTVALPRRQPVGEDGDEDQVVDAKNELERDQREETDPDGRVRNPFHRLLRQVQTATQGSYRTALNASSDHLWKECKHRKVRARWRKLAYSNLERHAARKTQTRSAAHPAQNLGGVPDRGHRELPGSPVSFPGCGRAGHRSLYRVQGAGGEGQRQVDLQPRHEHRG
jgi:hypothetical protein